MEGETAPQGEGMGGRERGLLKTTDNLRALSYRGGKGFISPFSTANGRERRAQIWPGNFLRVGFESIHDSTRLHFISQMNEGRDSRHGVQVKVDKLSGVGLG